MSFFLAGKIYCKSPGGSRAKERPANAGSVRDAGPTPGSGRPPGAGNGDPFQYFCLETPVDRGVWWATVQRVRHDWTDLAQHTSTVLKHDWMEFSCSKAADSANIIHHHLTLLTFLFFLLLRETAAALITGNALKSSIPPSSCFYQCLYSVGDMNIQHADSVSGFKYHFLLRKPLASP